MTFSERERALSVRVESSHGEVNINPSLREKIENDFRRSVFCSQRRQIFLFHRSVISCNSNVEKQHLLRSDDVKVFEKI